MGKARLAAAAVGTAALLTIGLAACGGGDDNGGSSDQDQVAQAITSAATGKDPSICTKYQTVKFDEQTNNGTGQAAVKSCEQDAGNSVADKVDVSDVSVNGNTATAKASVTGSVFDGQTLDIALVKQGGQWKLDEFKGFDNFDKDAMVAAFPEQLQSEPGSTPQAIDCVKTQLQQTSDQQLEQLFLSNDNSAGNSIFGPCGKYFKGG